MKKILFVGILGLLMCISCTQQPDREDFITDCEKSDFVKTPRFEETMAWFQRSQLLPLESNPPAYGTMPSFLQIEESSQKENLEFFHVILV